jgi:hypothetical protein
LIKNAYLGYAGSCVAPTKRMSGPSNILVNRKNLDLNKLTECCATSLNENELEMLNMIQQQLNWAQINQRNFAERIYYHTKTTMPITISEVAESVDSDAELDTEWLKDQTSLLINEFTDVNEGEKEIMRVWNLYFLKTNFICDAQMFEACQAFINEQAENIVRLKIKNNFLLHLANMYDYGLYDAAQLVKLVDLFLAKIETIS